MLLRRIYVFFIIVSFNKYKWAISLEFEYHTPSEIAKILHEFKETNRDPNLNITVYTIGRTKGERTCTNCTDTTTYVPNELWVVSITASHGEPTVPNVKLIGTIHGNEPVGQEILLHFLYFLRNNYRKDATVTHLLRNTKIHILPQLNPDGFEQLYHTNKSIGCNMDIGRVNGRDGRDLNKGFPSKHFNNDHFLMQTQETKAIQDWMAEVPFVLSVAFHAGYYVVYYPYETSMKKSSNDPTHLPHLTPDDSIFKYLATTYAESRRNNTVSNSECIISKSGVVNGAQFNSSNGAMADYNYDYHGCLEISVQLGCCKYPANSSLAGLWEENKPAIVKYLLQVHQGIVANIYDEESNTPIHNTFLITVFNRATNFSSTFFVIDKSTGVFWKVLLPGNHYFIKVIAEGYETKTVPFKVMEHKPYPKLQMLHIHLRKKLRKSTSKLVGAREKNERSSGFTTTKTYTEAANRFVPGLANRAFLYEDVTAERNSVDLYKNIKILNLFAIFNLFLFNIIKIY